MRRLRRAVRRSRWPPASFTRLHASSLWPSRGLFLVRLRANWGAAMWPTPFLTCHSIQMCGILVLLLVSLFRFSGAAGSDVLQCLMHLLCSASLVRPGLRALSTSSICVRSPACIASGSMSLTLWPAAMVGSQELPVLRRWCWGIWGLVVSLNNLGFGKNNLVPTVTVSFDALEAGDTVEGLFDL